VGRALIDGFDWTVLIKLVAVIVLVVANGFFVAAEFSLVAVRRSRVEHLGNEGRRRRQSAGGRIPSPLPSQRNAGPQPPRPSMPRSSPHPR